MTVARHRIGSSGPARTAMYPKTVGDLTVVVLTRDRRDLLRRALLSISQQKSVCIDVLVMVDDCQDTRDMLDALPRRFGAVNRMLVSFERRLEHERSGPARVARLREAAIAAVETEWMAFLDDDNTVLPHHCGTLLNTARSFSTPAAHSWRSLWTQKGEPYRLDGHHPWTHDRARSQAIYRGYEKAGIYTRHSSIVRDRVTPRRRDLSMVDTSEWIFSTSFIRQFEWCQQYTRDDWLDARAEDNKLLDQIVELGKHVPSTCKATLQYFFGGYSNNPLSEAASIGSWLLS